jgi:molecular chaperone DnaJ
MAEARRDYYEVLGVSHDADAKTIKNAFRRLALQYHPDRSREPGAEERFKEIAEAYAVLSDPKRRADYDAGGFAGVAGFTPEDLFARMDLRDIFGGLGFDSTGEGLFDRRFGRRRAGPPRGANVEVELVVSLERVLRGGEETVRFPRVETCGTCQGSGAKAGTSPRRCAACGGTGQHSVSRREAGVSVHTITTCSACHGRGSTIEQPCTDCRGGEVEREETLTVKVPVGIEEGMALCVPGRGAPSRERGGTAGDLFVIVRTAPDPRFERRGTDLWRVETIAVADAALGTRLTVPTLEGHATVTIPPGTQPDTVLRLRGKGLPEFGDRRRGDLHVVARVHVPEHVSREERALYERLRTLSQSGTSSEGRRAGRT